MNRMVTVEAGLTVLDAIREAGIQFEAICGKGNLWKMPGNQGIGKDI